MKCIAQLLYFSDLLAQKYPEDSANLFAALEKHNVAYGFIKGAKDVYIRDFMPIQVNAPFLVAFRYEPSYLKGRRNLQTHFWRDINKNWQLVNGWRPSGGFVLPNIRLEGGNAVLSPDGKKAVISDRVFSENPEYQKPELIRKLSEELRTPEIIIIPAPGSDITGHADSMVRFLDDKTVICNESVFPNGIEQQIKRTMRYHGLDVVEFPFAPIDNKGGVGRYLNYLETDEAVFLPVFGIETDARAITAAQKLFSKLVEPVKIPGIAVNGGGLHSISWGMTDYVWSD